MNIFKRKPGVILLPVSALFIIFIVLLVMLIGEKQSNNALLLEYRATRLIDLLLDLHLNGKDFEPAEIDENIAGFGLYNTDRTSLMRWGTAPGLLPDTGSRNSEIILTANKNIIIIRSVVDAALISSGVESRIRQMPPLMQKRMQDQMPMAGMRRLQTGVYLEYVNSSYIAERRLIIIIIGLFTALYVAAFILVFRLYRSNRRLILMAEHDRQLIQLGEAARTLAHEIRNPLGALKIQRDLLFRKLPAGYERNLEVIDRELKRLNSLVERVGEFLRNPVGKPDEINLSHFVAELYEDRENVSIQSAGESGKIYFDRERLGIVLDNLINNAIESGGSAEIQIFSSGGRTALRVNDRGSGFSDEAMSRMYDPFFTTKNTGTGLGLSVVLRLVEASGGSVKASNRKDGGASVVITFGVNNESADR